MMPLLATAGFASALWGICRATRSRGPTTVGSLLRWWACAGHVLSSCTLVAFLAALFGSGVGLAVAALQFVIIVRAWAWPWFERLLAVLTTESDASGERSAVLRCSACGTPNRVRPDYKGDLPGEAVCGRCHGALW